MLRTASNHRGEAGTAALEMALVLPIFLILALGIAILGHAYFTSYQLSSAAYEAARSCVMARTPTRSCAAAFLATRIGSRCESQSVTVSNSRIMGSASDGVHAFKIDLDCSYTGPVPSKFLRQFGYEDIGKLKARAAMPY